MYLRCANFMKHGGGTICVASPSFAKNGVNLCQGCRCRCPACPTLSSKVVNASVSSVPSNAWDGLGMLRCRSVETQHLGIDTVYESMILRGNSCAWQNSPPKRGFTTHIFQDYHEMLLSRYVSFLCGNSPSCKL